MEISWYLDYRISFCVNLYRNSHRITSTLLSLRGHRPCGKENMIFLKYHVTTELKWHVTLWVWPPHPDSAPYQGVMGLANVEIDFRFWFVTWPQYCGVMWLCGWGPLILSHHPAKFGVHKPYGTENNGVFNISSN